MEWAALRHGSFRTWESFFDSPPQLFFNEIAGFEISSRLYLLKYGALGRLDVIVR